MLGQALNSLADTRETHDIAIKDEADLTALQGNIVPIS
jgi:hypothetical protein